MDGSVKIGQSSAHLVEAIQALIADHASVDVRVRCKDHQPSDGLGAHRLILAAASPNYLKNLMLNAASEDDLICLHLPDFTSNERSYPNFSPNSRFFRHIFRKCF